MSDIQRYEVGSRLSQVVVHNGVAYLAGQVPDKPGLPVEPQTEQILASIDRLLAQVGSDKSRLLSAQVFLADKADFSGMNSVWEAWLPAGQSPARVTVEAAAMNPGYRVEIMVTAAL